MNKHNSNVTVQNNCMIGIICDQASMLFPQLLVHVIVPNLETTSFEMIKPVQKNTSPLTLKKFLRFQNIVDSFLNLELWSSGETAVQKT